MSNKKQLLIVADDFGVNKYRSRGIIELMKKGIITSASVLANGECTSEYLLIAKRENIAYTKFGAHLNLTEGLALTGSSSLTDENGRMLGKVGLRRRILLNGIQREDVESEIRAQICFLNKIMTESYEEPISLSHFDGHNHMHTIPELVPILAAVVSELEFKSVRIPNDIYYNILSEPLPELIPTDSNLEQQLSGTTFHSRIAVEARSASTVYKKFGLSYPKSFFGLTLMGSNCTNDSIKQALNHSPEGGIVEVMTHVGEPFPAGGTDPFFHDFFSESPDRSTESNVWQSVSSDIATTVTLVAFSDLVC